ncbi:MAG TPA: hypothetical protein VFA67_05265 [Candidatus Sulfotelmatobacter sp.]|nr:hypothetical protein [Candidatus Sulfotelmatobacter sp.]
MSAAAPALAATQRRIVVVRLADSAQAIGVLSLAYASMLVIFPVWFPSLIVRSWERGQLLPAMMIFAFLLDTSLYLRVAQRLSAKPGMLAAACLGSLPLLVVGGSSVLLQRSVKYALSSDLPNLHAVVGEEILAHTYLGFVAAVFLPFLAIRLLQQFRNTF